MTDVEKEIQALMTEAELEYYENEDPSVYNKIREHLTNIKNMVNDTYDIVDLWYRCGCEFPFEAQMNINGEERTISFDNIRQMLFEIRTLR